MIENFYRLQISNKLIQFVLRRGYHGFKKLSKMSFTTTTKNNKIGE